jgi:hypothetical protein
MTWDSVRRGWQERSSFLPSEDFLENFKKVDMGYMSEGDLNATPSLLNLKDSLKWPSSRTIITGELHGYMDQRGITRPSDPLPRLDTLLLCFFIRLVEMEYEQTQTNPGEDLSGEFAHYRRIINAFDEYRRSVSY